MMETGELSAAMARRFGLSDEAEIEAVRASFVRLHNEGRWDLIGLVERGEIQALEQGAFFMAAHFLSDVLPDLEAEELRVASAVERLVDHGGADLASTWPNGPFRKWCARDVRRSERLIAAALAGDERAITNLTFPLEALGSPSRAQGLLEAAEPRIRLSAITALGRITDADQQSRLATLAEFARLATDADEMVRANLLGATASLISQDGEGGSGEAEVDLVRQLTAADSPAVASVAARAIWSQEGARRPEIGTLLLEAAFRGGEGQAPEREIDMALSALLQAGEGGLVVDFLRDTYAGTCVVDPSQLTTFLSTLVGGPPEILATAVVAWLLGGSSQLCSALAGALSGDPDDAPVLDVTSQLEGLSEVELVFVCRKAVGFFFFRAQTAASALVCALRTSEGEAADEIQRLLTTVLLRNYSGVREYLSALPADDPAGVRIAAALADHDRYGEQLRAVPVLAELRPSETNRRVQRARMAEQNRAIIKSAREKSVFWKLVKRSTLLYGRRSLSFLSEPGRDPQRFEMDLKEQGFSIEVPRLQMIDPIGLDYMLRAFRVERLVE